MKKMLTMILSLTMVFTLAACGGEKEDSATNENVDLNAFYGELAEKYSWIGMDDATDEFVEDSITMMDLEGEMLENYYPGLAEINAKQLVVKVPMISAIVNEIVFMECATEEDAAAAAEILSNRVTIQAEGGAMYPESVAAWENAEVITNGTFVAMIASAQNQADITAAFNGLFA